MKTLFVLAVLLGAALAKPSSVEKDLVQLLEKYLQKKGLTREDPAPALPEIETTMLEGAPEGITPVKVFGPGGLIPGPVDQPLDVSELKDEFGPFLDNVLRVVKDLQDALNAYDGELTAEKVKEFVKNKLLPALETEEVNVFPLYLRVIGDAVRGAVSGTVNAPTKDEPGCAQAANEAEALECVLNKLAMLDFATDLAMGKVFELLFEKPGKKKDEQDASKRDDEDDVDDGEELIFELTVTAEYVRGYIQHIKDVFDAAPKPNNPLPGLILKHAFMQYILDEYDIIYYYLREIKGGPKPEKDERRSQKFRLGNSPARKYGRKYLN